jgi:xanthosine utilization system XapX-like protein
MADTSSSKHVFHPTWRTPVTTQELPISSYAVSRPPSQPRRNAERIFFSGMALLLCLVVFIGFFATFFGAGFVRAPLPNAVLRVHGIVFTAWMLLLVTQAALVSTGRVAWHRTLGIIAFGLPPLMVGLGVIAAVDALGRKVSIGPLDPATSLALPLVNIMAFAIVIAAAWKARRRPDAHKRLVLLATISLSTAALGRIPWAQLDVSAAAGPVIGLAALILLLVGYDVLTLRRVHRSTMWAAPIVFAAGALAVPFGMTPAWHRFAEFVMRTAVPYV